MIKVAGMIYIEPLDKVLLIDNGKGDLTFFETEHGDKAIKLKQTLSDHISNVLKIKIPDYKWTDICYFYLQNMDKLYCFIATTDNVAIVAHLKALDIDSYLIDRTNISFQSIVDPYTWVIPLALEGLRGSKFGRISTPCILYN